MYKHILTVVYSHICRYAVSKYIYKYTHIYTYIYLSIHLIYIQIHININNIPKIFLSIINILCFSCIGTTLLYKRNSVKENIKYDINQQSLCKNTPATIYKVCVFISPSLLVEIINKAE